MKRASLILTAALLLALLATVLPTLATGDAVGNSGAQRSALYTVHATAQRFEHGLMIWQSNNGLIRVIFDYGYVSNYPLSAYGPLPDNPHYNTPPNRVRPINGFGRVWGNSTFIRNTLGWALGPEVGYEMTLYVIHDVQYLTLLSNKVVEISPNNTWRYVDRIPSVPPTSTPPTPPPTGQPGAQIIHFTASPNPVRQGGTLRVVWQVANTQMALIEVYAYPDADQPLILLENLPLDGSRMIQLPGNLTGSVTLKLYAADRYTTPTGVVMYNRRASNTRTVAIHPGMDDTDYTQGAYQRYANGFMIWRADTGEIIVFGGTNGGPMSRFPLYSYGPLPDNPFYYPPPGRVRPINGFGRVWGHHELVRRMLGWALNTEEAYTLTVKLGPDGAVDSYTLPDGRIVRVSQYFWNVG